MGITFPVSRWSVFILKYLKYLGNIIHSSANLTFNIDHRLAKGQGVVTDIISFLEEIPLGPTRVKVGLILRESKFINSILYSGETWHSLTIRDTLIFERLDQFLLRNILFKCNSKTKVEFLHLETCTLKIKHILAGRRVLYLKYIL